MTTENVTALAALLREIMQRLVRVETRLASLMEHEGMTVKNKGGKDGNN